MNTFRRAPRGAVVTHPRFPTAGRFSGRTAADSSHTSLNLAKQTPAVCGGVRTTRYARARAID